VCEAEGNRRQLTVTPVFTAISPALDRRHIATITAKFVNQREEVRSGHQAFLTKKSTPLCVAYSLRARGVPGRNMRWHAMKNDTQRIELMSVTIGEAGGRCAVFP
jgi:hypothetical protein